MKKQTLPNMILRRIRGKGVGTVHITQGFLDLGSRAAVDQALSRLASKGSIRRIGRGIYDYPKVSSLIGVLSPDPDKVAQACAKKTGSFLQVSGARAANALGLSTQVPARIVYLTNGNSRRIAVGNQIIELKHAAPKNLAIADKPIGAVVQALRHIGRENINLETVQKLKTSLSGGDKAELLKHIDSVPNWMRAVIANITS